MTLRGLSGDLAPDNAVVLANAFTGEKYFSESVIVGGKRLQNVRAYLGGALLLQSFERKPQGGFNIRLLACYPYSMTSIDVVPHGESFEIAGGRILSGDEGGLRSSKFTEIILATASNVVPVTGLGATMQIRSITVAKPAQGLIDTSFAGNTNSFRHWMAGEIGAQLSKTVGISIIPFTEDTSSRKMAQVMENGEAYNIALPEPDYVVDVALEGFSRVKAKQTASESMWVYGAYARFGIVEAGTGRVVWEKQVKAGVAKRIAATQEAIDHSAAEFVALLKDVEQFPLDLLADSNARTILSACLK